MNSARILLLKFDGMMNISGCTVVKEEKEREGKIKKLRKDNRIERREERR